MEHKKRNADSINCMAGSQLMSCWGHLACRSPLRWPRDTPTFCMTYPHPPTPGVVETSLCRQLMSIYMHKKLAWLCRTGRQHTKLSTILGKASKQEAVSIWLCKRRHTILGIYKGTRSGEQAYPLKRPENASESLILLMEVFLSLSQSVDRRRWLLL